MKHQLHSTLVAKLLAAAASFALGLAVIVLRGGVLGG